MSKLRDILVPYQISSTDYEKLTKLIIWKNYFLICFSMWFFYTAVNAMGGVQSTINKEGGLGLASSCVVYSVFGLSAIMIPQLLMNSIKFKWTMTLGFGLQLFYVGLNAYPKWYTYMPASALGGFGQALAFTGAGTGVRRLCQIYCEVTKADSNSAQGLFFGVFGIFLQIAGVLGYLLIALIFGENSLNKKITIYQNSSNSSNVFNYTQCGSNFCPSSELPPSADPSINSVYLLVGILGTCSVISIILSLFLNDIDYIVKEDGITTKQIVKHQLSELKKQFFQINQLLAAPINLMNAFVLTFLWVDFTRSFAACSAGLDYIGWSTMVLYASAAIFSPIFGKLASANVYLVFIIYWLLTIGTCVFMLFWESDPNKIYMLFILAILLGIIESINTPLPRALYGMLFKTEVIYSSFTLFQGIGMLFGFLITTFCCTRVKIIIMMCYCGVCFFCGLGLYLLKRKEEKAKEKYTINEIWPLKINPEIKHID